MEEQNFGARMVALRQQRGEHFGGRKPIAEKYRTQIAATERAFARSMPDEATRYVDELAPKEPECCPEHGRVLRCPACTYESQRTAYNHRAASYVFDRIMGKPTSRSESAITVRLVEQITTAIVVAFGEVNAIDDPIRRQQAFAAKCVELGAQWGGPQA